MEQPTAAEAVPPGPAPTPQPQRVDWYWFIGFIVCMLAGQSIGEQIGAGYENVGEATGKALGSWIGFGIGGAIGSVVGSLIGRRVRRQPLIGRQPVGTVLMLILVYGVLMACALGGEILAGKPGGLAGVCAPVLLLFLVAIIWRLAKKR
jgi:hypothetical protein